MAEVQTNPVREHASEHMSIREYCLPDGYEMAEHCHDALSIGILMDGSYDGICGDRRDLFSGATVIFYPPGTNASARFRDRTNNFPWLMPPADKAAAPDRPPDSPPDGPPEVVSFSGGPVMLAAWHLRARFAQGPAPASLGLDYLVRRIVARAQQFGKRVTGPPRRRWLETVLGLLDSDLSERRSLGDLASASGLHRSHLARDFKQEVGLCAGEYRRRMRIYQAARDLLESGISVAEVAADYGFYDQSHFRRHFKRHLGLSPSDYRSLRSEAGRSNR